MTSAPTQAAVTNDARSERRRQADETAAFWFRRMSSAIALSNAAGVVVMAGVVGDGNNLREAASFIYLPMIYFISGGIYGVVLFALQMAHAFFDLWKKVETDAAKTWEAVAFVVYVAAFLIVLLLGGACFVLGCKTALKEMHMLIESPLSAQSPPATKAVCENIHWPPAIMLLSDPCPSKQKK